MHDATPNSPVQAEQPDQAQPTYDPSEWTPLIERAFFDRLGRLFGPVEDQVRDRLAARIADLEHLVTNPMDAANVRFTALAIAAFEVLSPMCGAAEAAAIVDDCLNSPLRPQVIEGTAAMLDNVPDPFVALVEASKEREQTYFGPSFTFERPVDDQDTYVLDIKRCVFHETLAAAGRTELQPILCRFDLNWADAIDPDRHHLRFVRPVTFASGDTCRMVFTRQEHLSPPEGCH
ncbi:L-2-amino-thiazoline-4-carboxylic acid hydrolase [Catenulispora rubra]|uniref:L-2-amino-thiazoline-4-carboxylic acid hydrolase n=1 Tax=Catenulispora rubra TaxID=280293 RepID=UPI0018922BBA|nr:L-2-amino-thiazoline-4-carboxylic acid hydrolase [Catenulispora rubra]